MHPEITRRAVAVPPSPGMQPPAELWSGATPDGHLLVYYYGPGLGDTVAPAPAPGSPGEHVLLVRIEPHVSESNGAEPPRHRFPTLDEISAVVLQLPQGWAWSLAPWIHLPGIKPAAPGPDNFALLTGHRARLVPQGGEA